MTQHVPGFPRFTLEPNKMGGQACIRGYRFTLDQLLEMLADGMSSAEIIKAFPFIEPEDVDDALQLDKVR
jgi:uncharacterized protein (DUF433 family)